MRARARVLVIVRSHTIYDHVSAMYGRRVPGRTALNTMAITCVLATVLPSRLVVLQHSTLYTAIKMSSSSTPSTPVSVMRRDSKPEECSPSSLQSQWKHSTHLASTQSRRSHTLWPSSWRQGALKTIIMKKSGESVQKKRDLACLFCQDRKIACGDLPEGDHHQPMTHAF